MTINIEITYITIGVIFGIALIKVMLDAIRDYKYYKLKKDKKRNV